MQVNSWRIRALRGGLLTLLGCGVIMSQVHGASAADVSWNVGKPGTTGDEVSGAVGNVRAFVAAGKTLKAAAFQMATDTGALSPAYLSWFDQKDGPYQTAGGGGLGVVGPGESGDEALLDNVGAFDIIIFALPADGGTFVNFHVNGGGTGTSYSHLMYYVGGTLTDGGGSAADPFSKFVGKNLSTITAGWTPLKPEIGSTSRDRSININSDQGFTGHYLIIFAEAPNTKNNTIADRFAVDKVSADGPQGCQDTAAPNFTAPANRTLASTGDQACGAQVPDLITGLTGTDDCGPVTFTQAPAKNTLLSGKGPHPVAITARDGAGRTNTRTVWLTVEDQPVITACPGAQTVNADAQCSLAMPAVLVGFRDACSTSVGVVQAPAAGTDLDYGLNTVVVTVTDEAGHTAQCITTVIFTDDTAPTIACPADLAVSTDLDSCFATLDPGQPEANDNCSETALAVGGAPGDVYPTGDTELTWTATDSALNSATCEQLITVSDGQQPDLTCPADVVVPTDPGLCEAIAVDLGAADATDNCAVVGDPMNDGPGVFGLGDTLVTWSVADAAGNASTCSQVVNVVDEEAPTMVCPDEAILVSSPTACYAAFGDLGTPIADDNCGGDPIFVNDAAFPMGLGASTVYWSVADVAGNTDSANDCAQGVIVLSGAGVGFLPPLKGQPVMNEVNTAAQTLPHKVRVTDCAGAAITYGVIVKLRIEGVYDPADGEPYVVEDVLEVAQGRGEIIDGEAIMEHDGGGQYHFNVDTTAFGWANTSADASRWYTSTASVYDAATGAFLGATSVDLETKARGKAK